MSNVHVINFTAASRRPTAPISGPVVIGTFADGSAAIYTFPSSAVASDDGDDAA